MSLHDKGKSSYLYLGNSMSPTFHHLDKLIIEPIHISKIRTGDVIAFTLVGRSQRIVHRVVKIGSNCVQTQGDNRKDPDTFAVTDNDPVFTRLHRRRRCKSHTAKLCPRYQRNIVGN